MIAGGKKIQHGGCRSPAKAWPSPPEGWALKGSPLCASVGPPADSKHGPRSKAVRKEKAKDTLEVSTCTGICL